MHSSRSTSRLFDDEEAMTKRVGIVACSAEGAALCYRTLCTEAAATMGEHMHPEVSMHTHPLAVYMRHVRIGAWDEVAALMADSAAKLAAIGADFAICPDNTIHQAFERAVAASPIPWLHIADAVADRARADGCTKLAITGTKYLMTGPVYPTALARVGIDCLSPDATDRARIDAIIFDELVNGVLREESRRALNDIIAKMKRGGCDAVVLGCTELPLLVDSNDCPLPTYDSTRLLARAALAEATR
jgi:aspartate racemase